MAQAEQQQGEELLLIHKLDKYDSDDGKNQHIARDIDELAATVAAFVLSVPRQATEPTTVWSQPYFDELCHFGKAFIADKLVNNTDLESFAFVPDVALCTVHGAVPGDCERRADGFLAGAVSQLQSLRRCGTATRAGSARLH